MSVTITITDPTEEEARRVADYLMELGKYWQITRRDDPVPTKKNPFIGSNPTYMDEHPELAPEPAVVIPPAPVAAAVFAEPVAEIPTLFTPAPPTGVELDASDLPWDGRIHSDTKSKIGNGTWRTRRGVDPALVATVTAELKAAMGAPAATVTPSVPVPLASVPTPAAVVPTPPPFVASAAPSVPPVPTTPAAGLAGAAPTVSPSDAMMVAPSVPPVAIAITTFPQLMMAITKGIGKGTFTQPDVVKAIEGVGLASIPMLASRPDLIPTVAAALGV